MSVLCNNCRFLCSQCLCKLLLNVSSEDRDYLSFAVEAQKHIVSLGSLRY